MSERWNEEEYKADINSVYQILYNPNWIPKVIKHTDFTNLRRRLDVIETGCGSGKWSATFALLNCNVTALDNNKKILKRVHSNFPNIKIRYVLADLLKLPYDLYGKFDLVFSEGVLEHFIPYETRQLVLHNMYMLCKPEGYIAVYVPGRSEEEDEHFYENKEELSEELFTAGFINIYSDEISFISADGFTNRIFFFATGRKGGKE